jgi:hypothetical protein
LTACRSFLCNFIPKVPQTYGTGRIEAQAQSARQTVNKALIGKNLLNDANSAHFGPECCHFGDHLFRNGNNAAARTGLPGL